jgi:unsaturated rhamnogalacturonyl hydrolase
MIPTSAANLLLVALLICCTGWTAAPAPPQQDGSLYLPLLWRGLPPHPNAALLRSIGQAGAERVGDECDWEAGVLAWGWVKMWEATGDEQYWQWTRIWVDGCLQRGIKIEHVNGVPLAYAALSVYSRDPQARYWELAEQAGAYIFSTAPRTQDGTLIHLADMVWDDTLFGVVPFLIKMWQMSGESRYLDEAVSQIEKHVAHLQDPATGLFHHAWSEPQNSFSGPFFWGRGNGWVVLAQAELLAEMPPGDARRRPLLTRFEQQVQALVARQAPDGMWHTIVTRKDFYTETSAAALITAALTLGIEQNLFAAPLLHDARAAAEAGRLAVWRQVSAKGVVVGVSGPTGPMDQENAYNDIAVVDLALYGQGAALLAGAASMPGP